LDASLYPKLKINVRYWDGFLNSENSNGIPGNFHGAEETHFEFKKLCHLEIPPISSLALKCSCGIFELSNFVSKKWQIFWILILPANLILNLLLKDYTVKNQISIKLN
jgi:hypothetical protein